MGRGLRPVVDAHSRASTASVAKLFALAEAMHLRDVQCAKSIAAAR